MVMSLLNQPLTLIKRSTLACAISLTLGISATALAPAVNAASDSVFQTLSASGQFATEHSTTINRRAHLYRGLAVFDYFSNDYFAALTQICI